MLFIYFVAVSYLAVQYIQQQQQQRQHQVFEFCVQQFECSMHSGREGALALSSSLSVVSSIEGRQQLFRNELGVEVVSIENLRRLCTNGVPEGSDFRAITWKLLLGLLPPRKSGWADSVANSRTVYKAYCEDLIIIPDEENRERQPGVNGVDVDVTEEDHPLAMTSSSKWSNYFRDQEIREQIERDVMRTHPDLHFFSGDGEEAALHREEMMRALFIFAKLNPGVTYVQGMNEIYAPLYYVFSKDTEPGNGENAEADAFFCFLHLMGEFRDNFCKQLDNTDTGIQSTMKKLSQMLKWYDKELWHHLEHVSQVNPQFYAFRWITLLLTQEFQFPDVLQLWDTMIGSSLGKSACLLNLCVAMLMHIRSELLSGDFSQNMKILQNYPSVDIGYIIQKALELPTYRRG